MPCRDDRDDCSNEDLQEANTQIAELTGMLCALVGSVISTTTHFADFLEQATKDGECDDILTWYEKHVAKDKERMKQKLSSFSVDELELIASMLEKGEL